MSIAADTSWLNPIIPTLMSTETATPRVSVIIPVYQGDRFLGEAVESVLNQTYTNYEIIVVDDGSTDNSLEVLEHYFDKICYVFQGNQGVAAARNRGLQIARGEFIAFLDQDDFWLPEKLALQIACFDAQPELGIVHCGWRRVDGGGKLLGDIEPWHKAPNLNLEEWVQWKPILLSAMMFRHKWLERVGGLDTRFQQVCDLDIALRLTLMGCQSTWLYQVTVCYREHDRNESQKTFVQAHESWAVLDKFFARSEVPEQIRKLENQYRYYTLVWSAWRLYCTGYVAEMIQYLKKSLIYTPYSRTKTVSDWVKSFSFYAKECDCRLDTVILSNSAEWQQLINYVLN